jgi:hypothetical protein
MITKKKRLLILITYLTSYLHKLIEKKKYNQFEEIDVNKLNELFKDIINFDLTYIEFYKFCPRLLDILNFTFISQNFIRNFQNTEIV